MKCAVFGLNFPTNCPWVAFLFISISDMTLYTEHCIWCLHPLISSLVLFSGDCWTLYPWKDAPPVGQNKVPGSLWAHLGSVLVPAQVSDLSLGFLLLPHPSCPPNCYIFHEFTSQIISFLSLCIGIRFPWTPPRPCFSWWQRRACRACPPAWGRFIPVTVTPTASSTSRTLHRKCSEHFSQQSGLPVEPGADVMNWALNYWWRHHPTQLGEERDKLSQAQPVVFTPKLHFCLPHEPLWTLRHSKSLHHTFQLSQVNRAHPSDALLLDRLIVWLTSWWWMNNWHKKIQTNAENCLILICLFLETTKKMHQTLSLVISVAPDLHQHCDIVYLLSLCHMS